ncbi:hypothetical protein F4801DRAFT_603577 [Xylaria longipes]|nr:hypothetical protein F4801DRAFT_603577 [Xylaria longipes]
MALRTLSEATRAIKFPSPNCSPCPQLTSSTNIDCSSYTLCAPISSINPDNSSSGAAIKLVSRRPVSFTNNMERQTDNDSPVHQVESDSSTTRAAQEEVGATPGMWLGDLYFPLPEHMRRAGVSGVGREMHARESPRERRPTLPLPPPLPQPRDIEPPRGGIHDPVSRNDMPPPVVPCKRQRDEAFYPTREITTPASGVCSYAHSPGIPSHSIRRDAFDEHTDTVYGASAIPPFYSSDGTPSWQQGAPERAGTWDEVQEGPNSNLIFPSISPWTFSSSNGHYFCVEMPTDRTTGYRHGEECRCTVDRESRIDPYESMYRTRITPLDLTRPYPGNTAAQPQQPMFLGPIPEYRHLPPLETVMAAGRNTRASRRMMNDETA